MNTFSVKTDKRTQFINIDSQIRQIVRERNIRNGLCVVTVPHTTAGITINENADPEVRADVIEKLDQLIPWQSGYRHSEGNSAAHIKTSIMGSSVTLIVAENDIRTGTWQSVFFCEFDGPRNRQVWVEVMGA